MQEIIFLIILAIIWMIIAIIQDFKKNEVDNWVNFSLIIFALGFRFFYCLFNSDTFMFFYQGLIGLGIFFILANLFYYTHLFAGGDAKLLIALGAILPFSESFYTNLNIFILFILIWLFVGAIYSLISSLYLFSKNTKKFNKEFENLFNKHKKTIILASLISLILIFSGILFNILLIILGILILIFPFLLVYGKSLEKVGMIKKISVSKLTEGDWLVADLKIGNKTIKATWDGLTKKDINLIKKKYKHIEIKQGIPFTPVFLISFLILIYLIYSGFNFIIF